MHELGTAEQRALHHCGWRGAVPINSHAVPQDGAQCTPLQRLRAHRDNGEDHVLRQLLSEGFD